MRMCRTGGVANCQPDFTERPKAAPERDGLPENHGKFPGTCPGFLLHLLRREERAGEYRNFPAVRDVSVQCTYLNTQIMRESHLNDGTENKRMQLCAENAYSRDRLQRRYSCFDSQGEPLGDPRQGRF